MISAIVLAYNRSAEVLKTIEKLKHTRQSFPYQLEIIVVDNASVDDTSALVREQHPDVVLVTKPQNNGIAGWNEGFKVATQKYFLVLDDDSHVHSGLTEAVARMENNPDIGILAMQIVDESLKTDPNLKDDEAWKDNEEVAGFIGCGAIIRKELYDKIGGFAEWIYVYTHEFEYALRCLSAGYKVKFFAGGIVVHRVSKINRSNRRLRVYATRNELLIVHKYFTHNKLKYLFRVVINNLKFMKREGFLSGYYILQGFFKFLGSRKRVGTTPATKPAQVFFADAFWSTKPIFNRFRKRVVNN